MRSWTTNEKPKLGGQSGTIGGSNVAGVLDLSKYSDPHLEWQKMTGRHVVKPSEAMERGSILEPVVQRLVEWLGYPKASLIFRMAQDDRLTFKSSLLDSFYWQQGKFSASVDAEIYKTQEDTGELQLHALAEFKTMSARVSFESEHAVWQGHLIKPEMPVAYWLQVQHYLHARDAGLAFVFCLRAESAALTALKNVVKTCGVNAAADVAAKMIDEGAAEFIARRVKRDSFYTVNILPYLEEWHDRHVLSDIPPEATHRDSCKSYLLSQNRFGAIDATGELEYTIEQLAELKDEIQELETAYKAKLNYALDLMGPAEKAICSAGQISVVTSKESKVFDSKALLAAMPDLAERFSKTRAASKSVRFKKAK